MALLFMDSWDHYATADLTEKWTASGVVSGGTIAVTSAIGRHSSAGLRFNCGGVSTAPLYWVQKVLTPADATMTMGLAVLVPTGLIGTAGLALASVKDGVTAQVTLRINNDFTLSVVRGAHDGTTLGSTAAITAGAFVFLEWQVLIHPSAGTVNVRINGVSALALTAQNTRNSAASQWTSVTLGMNLGVTSSTLNSTKNTDYDDLYVLDGTGAAPWNTFLGDCRVDALYPTGAGATTGWTPSAGANWDCVNDTAPNDDTDYTAATATATDTFVVQDVPVAGATVYGVQSCFSAKKMDTGNGTIAPVIRHSGTNYPGADLGMGTTYAYVTQIAQVNPGTGAPWTSTGVNAAEFGYTRTA